MTGPAVAIAVVSWNTRGLLERCLRSLEAEHSSGRAQVWVVDNASRDGSGDLVRERFGWARLVESRRNLGFGAAVNLVAGATATPWIAAANADTELEPGSLSALLDAGARHPRAGALAPRLLLPDGSTQHSPHPFPTLPFTILFNSGLAALSPRLGDRLCLEGAWDPTRERRVPWAIGALLLLRREAFAATGGFSEEQWMYAEDLDLGWRLARAGWPTVYVPAAHVRHRSGASTGQLWGAHADSRWMASTYAWMLSRRGAPLTRMVAAVNVLGALGRAVLFGLLARLHADRWGTRAVASRRWARLHCAGLRPRSELLEHR